MPPRRHVTPRMLAANRANAQRSTGPRTPEGKARSRANSLGHGLRAGLLAPPLLESADDRAAFADLVAALRAEFAPAGPPEESLIVALAQSCFGLRRALQAEAAALVQVYAAESASPALPVSATTAALPRVLAAVARYEAPWRRLFWQSLRQLRALQAQRRHLAALPQPQPAFSCPSHHLATFAPRAPSRPSYLSRPSCSKPFRVFRAAQPFRAKQKLPNEANLHTSLRRPLPSASWR